MKQTAVEWLIEQLVKMDKELDGRRKNEDATVLKMNPTKIYEQAKAMEKEQIINAFLNGDDLSHLSFKEQDKEAEQYYNETYGKSNS